MPQNCNQMFHLNVTRKSNGQFYMSDTSAVKEYFNMSSINLSQVTSISGKFVPEAERIIIEPSHDSDMKGIICRRQLTCFNTSSYVDENAVDFLLQYYSKLEYQQMLVQYEAEVKDAFQRMNLTNLYKNILATLWHSTVPCTSLPNSFSSLGDIFFPVLKHCEWKGVAMNCSEIFTAFPTEQVKKYIYETFDGVSLKLITEFALCDILAIYEKSDFSLCKFRQSQKTDGSFPGIYLISLILVFVIFN
jgi:hypothetical protein